MPLPLPLSLSLDLVEVKLTENDIPGALLSEPLEAHTMRERERERRERERERERRERERERERHSRTSPFMKPLQPRATLTSTRPSL